MTKSPPFPWPAKSRMTTLLVSVPMDSIVTDTSSPSVSGPTPSGVPVSITSPGSSVITELTYSISDGTSHSSSDVGHAAARSRSPSW